mmetsp:Transcript_24236/g.52967  ORF Transcript_24236/g.52967 Transcript_24236/m.52967 type:complete len:260 (-) Transcript_24236:603-1382(-)|eukprot:CAMPEP_0202915702 /NCGR_PEP_ID=MMETSP1392-20130828/66372_1 /ASSEMBLY_ACC=CAM_ASM_000868 /TAXON_ID=225041 /ORGANISM="Chlamydomonas chlamydogama, Strain SAG 11-48b" /LENGTH=259 /DNA_ID=CAMNT_0049607827 /DNA_START=206 /DNA_END=988 /DNA_ORIENTATION=+
MEDGAPRVARAGRRARQFAETQDESGDAGLGDMRPPEPSVGFGERPLTAAQTLPAVNEGEDDGPPAPRRGGFASPTGSSSMSGGGIAQGEAPSPRPPPAMPSMNMDPLADDGGPKFTGVSKRKQDQRMREEEEKQQAKSKYEDRVNNAEAILDIPELEEEGKEDLTRVVAEAPKVRSNKVQGMEELDEDMQFRLPSTDDRDIDLSLLTAVLCSSEQVNEPDEAWDPDMLFTNVASELNQEKEKAEGVTEGEGKDINDQQ